MAVVDVRQPERYHTRRGAEFAGWDMVLDVKNKNVLIMTVC